MKTFVMKAVIACASMVAVAGIVAATASPSWATPLLVGDVRTDYVLGTSNGQTTKTVTSNTNGLPDSTNTGVWNIYRMDYTNSGNPQNPNYDGVLTLLPWSTSAFSGSYQTGIATVSSNGIWDGMTPTADELAWHGGGVPGDPFNSTKRNTVIRWTAGATAPSIVDLSGHIRLPYSGYSAKTISIYHNNALLWSYTAVNGVDVNNDVSHSYSVPNVAISPGSTIDYMLESGSGGRAALSAQITTVPEPSTGMLVVAAAAGVGLVRRRSRSAPNAAHG